MVFIYARSRCRWPYYTTCLIYKWLSENTNTFLVGFITLQLHFFKKYFLKELGMAYGTVALTYYNCNFSKGIFLKESGIAYGTTYSDSSMVTRQRRPFPLEWSGFNNTCIPYRMTTAAR